MAKKRILICDDNKTSRDTLTNILKESYDVFYSHYYKNVINDLKTHGPIQLLILDLGFDESGSTTKDEYIAHKEVPDIIKFDPGLKIIIRSNILTKRELTAEALEISRELMGVENVCDFISTADLAPKIRFSVDKAIGSPKWLKDGEIWMLHLSDIQFGGEGLPVDNKTLATKVVETIQKFVDSEPDNDEEGRRRHPFLTLITGDITEHGFPKEFDEFSEFAKILTKQLSEMTTDFVGILDNNTIFIPGNHDMNMNILQAQNLHKVNEKIIYKYGVSGKDPDLEFLKSYSWKPFCEVEFGNLKNANDWICDPGYKLINLKDELGIIFVCLNSSFWGHDHIERHNIVPEDIWFDINKELHEKDKDNNACRILLVHHSIADNIEPKNRLILKKGGDVHSLLRDQISRTCNFAAVFTGHTHEQAASSLKTGSKERKLVHIGAGTLQSDNTPKYRNPEFNIIKISDFSPDNDKFLSLTVYSFHWSGSNFGNYNTFEDNTKFSEKFDLLY